MTKFNAQEVVKAGFIPPQVAQEIDEFDTGFHLTDKVMTIQQTLTEAKERFEKDGIARFELSPSEHLRANIVAQVGDVKKRRVVVTLAKVKEKADKETITITKTYLIGTKVSKYKIVDSEDVAEDFWEYQARHKDKALLVLSREPLDTGNHELHGLLIEASSDEEGMGNLKLATHLGIFLVHNAEPLIPKLTTWQKLKEFSASKKITRDGIGNFLFAHEDLGVSLRQHPQREDLIFAQLLSGKQGGYALHCLTIGEAEVGKTKPLEAIHAKMGESSGVLDASTGTIKKIIPSFHTKIPSPGYLLSTNRLASVDELLRLLVREEENDNQRQMFPLMNSLLEQSDKEYGAGTGGIRARMKSKVMAMSNYVWGTQSGGITQLRYRIDPSWVSRMLVVFILNKPSDEWARWVSEKTHVEEIRKEIGQDDWLAVFDGCNSFTFPVDNSKVLAFLAWLEKGVPVPTDMPSDVNHDVLKFLRTRQAHHIYLLIDGMAKLRLVTQADKFEGIDICDYLAAFRLYCELLRRSGIDFIPGRDTDLKDFKMLNLGGDTLHKREDKDKDKDKMFPTPVSPPQFDILTQNHTIKPSVPPLIQPEISGGTLQKFYKPGLGYCDVCDKNEVTITHFFEIDHSQVCHQCALNNFEAGYLEGDICFLKIKPRPRQRIQ